MGQVKWKKYPDDELYKIINESQTKKEVLEKLGYNTSVKNNHLIDDIISHLKFEPSDKFERKLTNKKVQGQRFGNLLILEVNDSLSKEKRRTWVKVKCDCGKIIDVSYNALQRNNTKSCGCLNIKRENLIGTHFGRWTVLEESNDGKYLCQCQCGTLKNVLGEYLKNGVSQSCGCLQKEIVKKISLLI